MATPTPPTIHAVAKRAGVAISTVSRVLNGGQSSDKTRRRVEDAIRLLKYTPSPTARNLKLGRTGIVGLAGQTLHAPWFVQLLVGMERTLRRHSASLAIASLETDGKFDPSPIENWIKHRSVDSLALVRPGPRELDLAARAEKARIPVAFILPDLDFESGIVMKANNTQGGHLAGKHLAELGHREVCFFGGPIDSLDTQNRLTGLREALAEIGAEIPDERVDFAPTYNPECGIRAAEIWLSSAELRRTTAVVFGNDAMAMTFMRTVQAAGLRVPDDVSVIGFDGVPEGEFAFPGLTSVSQPTSKMGQDAASHLLTRRRLPNSPRQFFHYELSLIVRQSTSTPRLHP